LIVAKNGFPKVDFIYDPNTDADCAVGFLDDSRSETGANFLKGFLPEELHLVIGNTLSNEERERVIRDYVSDYYKRNEKDLKNRFELIKPDWSGVEEKYFNLIGQLFNNHPWPDGEYAGFGTIFHIYPRFIAKKTFYFPLNHKIEHYANKVIAHEMLHFMFFDYIEKKYKLGEKSEIRGRETDYLWKVSEAFNSVIQGWPPYQELFSSKPNPHPEVVEVYKKMNEQWRRNQNVDVLLKRFLDI